MSPFPKTIEELKTSGYIQGGDAKCRGCGADMTWWKSPNDKSLPMDRNTANPHWSTCTHADQFRKGKE